MWASAAAVLLANLLNFQVKEKNVLGGVDLTHELESADPPLEPTQQITVSRVLIRNDDFFFKVKSFLVTVTQDIPLLATRIPRLSRSPSAFLNFLHLHPKEKEVILIQARRCHTYKKSVSK